MVAVIVGARGAAVGTGDFAMPSECDAGRSTAPSAARKSSSEASFDDNGSLLGPLVGASRPSGVLTAIFSADLAWPFFMSAVTSAGARTCARVGGMVVAARTEPPPDAEGGIFAARSATALAGAMFLENSWESKLLGSLFGT